MNPRQQFKILQKTKVQPWRQIIVQDGSIKETKVYLEEREALVQPHQQKQSIISRAISASRSLFRRTMLPTGYPHTVHPNYARFNGWSFLQGVMGSASGVLSTQCLLVGLQMAGTTSASSSPAGTIAIAATLNWILKDGIGNLGGILFVSWFGAHFDKDAKRYRFFSALAINLATILECLVPLVPSLFLPLASIANTCKSVSWMANSATRAQMQRHFTVLDNLGDLTGKAASLNTAAVVAGTGLGVILSSIFLASTANMTAALLVSKCLLICAPLILVYLWANYKSCRLGVSPRLTRQRLDIVMRNLAASISDSKGNLLEEKASQLSRYILDPTGVGAKEKFLFAPWKQANLTHVSFEPPATKLAELIKSDEHLSDSLERFFTTHNYIACHGTDGKLMTWFSDEMSEHDVLQKMLAIDIADSSFKHSKKEWLKCLLEADKRVAERIGNSLVESLSAKGWQLSLTDLDRSPIMFKCINS